MIATGERNNFVLAYVIIRSIGRSAYIRTHEGTQQSYAFLMNFAHTEQTVTFRVPKRDLLTDAVLHGVYRMRPFEVCVIEFS